MRLIHNAALVFAAGCTLRLLDGCTTPEVMCGMQPVRDVGVAPLGFRINTTINVVSQSDLDALCHHAGLLGCNTGSAIFVRPQPKFSDPCSLAILGHEVLHQAVQHVDVP